MQKRLKEGRKLAMQLWRWEPDWQRVQLPINVRSSGETAGSPGREPGVRPLPSISRFLSPSKKELEAKTNEEMGGTLL